MFTERIKRVEAAMEAAGIEQLLISDTVSIRYLTDFRLSFGERLGVLLLKKGEEPLLFLNDLFSVPKTEGLRTDRYNDIEDGVGRLSAYIDRDKVIGIDKNWPARFLIRMMELGCAAGYVNGSELVDGVRRIKDEEEQALMRQSSLLNDAVMGKVLAVLSEKHTEKELDVLIRNLYAQEGCEDVSFEPIAAFGGNGADPHHGPDESVGQKGQGVVIDIGGFYKGYASDMTRTVFLGEVSERQREIYEIVREANLRGIAAAKPGNRMCDVDLAARNYIEEKGFGPYFTHRTGHSIGLEDHETGDVSSVNTAVIRPGQCFSVEPGIYLPEEGIGVRIEDLVLITEDGCEVLNHFSKDLTVIPYEDEGK